MNSNMKRIKNIFVMVAVLASIVACDRDFDSDEIAVGVIRFPAIQVLGDPVVIVPAGSSYTDAGARASLGTDDITSTLETTNNINLNAPGIYTVNYSVSTVNELGQESSVTQVRTVVVPPTTPNTTVDLSGTYTRTTAAGVAPVNWTKVAPGLYLNDNVGAVIPPSVAILPVFVFHYANGTISVPAQPVPNGYNFLGANVTLTPAGYNIVIPNTAGFGTGNRILVKQ